MLDFLTPTGLIGLGVLVVVLTSIIFYFFELDEIELGIPPKAKLKRRVRSRKQEPAKVEPAPTPVVPPPAESKPPLAEFPKPNLVHPYGLQANFTGREQERKDLTAWLADDAHPICALVAMGGMGKSALAWYWLMKDVLGSPSPPSPQPSPKGEGVAVMWWSFYEGEVSFAKFVDEALKYVSKKDIDAARLPTTYDRALELRRELQSKRVLFVLDGFERQLRAYARLDAAYQRDDATESSREARACVEPDAARLLKDIAAGTTRAKVLITSRLMVSDLEDRAGDALAGVLDRELKELGRDDAIAFMRAQGVKQGTPAEIATVCEAYGNHPLSLRLLSGLIARDTRTPGDIAAAPRHDVHADLVQRQHHVLEQSYNALPEKERTLLSRIAAFRSVMTYDALAIFNEFDDPSAGSGQVSAKFDAALNDLQARGLLQRDIAAGRNRYDLHLIVRHYCYDRLIDKKGVHTRLYNYFATQVAKVVPKAKELPGGGQLLFIPAAKKGKPFADLQPTLELYHHTVRASRYDEAYKLFYYRLLQQLYFHFGSHQTCIELLQALFPDGDDHPPRLKDSSEQEETLSEVANSYALLGQSLKALQVHTMAIAIGEKLRFKNILTDSFTNSARNNIRLGELTAAEQNVQRGIELSREIKDEFREAISHRELGRLLAYRGAFDDATRKLDMALGLFEKQNAIQSIVIVWLYRALRAFLMGGADTALMTSQHAFEFWKRDAEERYPVEKDLVEVEWLWGAALVMEGKDLNNAATHLTEALTRCRRINLVELEPDILLAWAKWHRIRGPSTSTSATLSVRSGRSEAQVYAEEALAIADRCEYRLKQAEIHNFLARLALDAGNRALARQHAEIAKERAWCEGSAALLQTRAG